MAWTSTKTKLPSHDHDLGPMNAWKSETCARCIQNAAATGREIHTCEHGGAFGRRDLACRRCRQLAEGVNVSTPIGDKIAKAKRDSDSYLKAIREHKCDSSCGYVCTKFEW